MNKMISIGSILGEQLKTEEALADESLYALDSLDMMDAGFNMAQSNDDIDETLKVMSGVLDSLDILESKEDDSVCLKVEDALALPMNNSARDAEETSKFSIKELIKKLWSWVKGVLQAIDEKTTELVISAKVMFTGVEKRIVTLREQIELKDSDKFKDYSKEDKLTLLSTIGAFIARADKCGPDTFAKILTSFKDIRKINDMPGKLVKGINGIEESNSYKITDVDDGQIIQYYNDYGELMEESLSGLPKYLGDLGGNLDAARDKGFAKPSSTFQTAKELLAYFGGRAAVKTLPYSSNGNLVRYMSYGITLAPTNMPTGVSLIGYSCKLTPEKVLNDGKVTFDKIELMMISKVLKGLESLDFKKDAASLAKVIKTMRKDDPTKDIMKTLDMDDADASKLSKEDKVMLKQRVKLVMRIKKDIAGMCKDIMMDNISLGANIAKACTIIVNAYENKK